MEDVLVVTGATGRVGNAVAQRLLAAGRAVRVIARHSEKLSALGAQGADVRVGSFQDRPFLTDVLRGAKAVFVLTPADISVPDLNAEQHKNVVNIAAAIRDSGVGHVVALSSWGAELQERIGGIIACHWLEQLLDDIGDLNAVYLRPVWFMENFIYTIGLIKAVGINGSAVKPDVSFPTVATSDIAAVAADYLQTLSFEGRHVRYLNGPRDYTMAEVTRILGASIGKPGLRYAQFPDPVMRKGLISSTGMSANAADIVIETNHGINTRRLNAESRSPLNTTPTTLEEFARTTFAPRFRSSPDVAFRLGSAGRSSASTCRRRATAQANALLAANNNSSRTPTNVRPARP
jgi:uncharacterized protein YbjT (DUF2867 family)